MLSEPQVKITKLHSFIIAKPGGMQSILEVLLNMDTFMRIS
jgi:hypothetical protein